MSDQDPFDLEGQEREEENRKDLAKLEEATEANDFRWLMADPRGRRMARRWLRKAGVWQISFTGDPLTTAFAEGQRNLGLWLLHRIAVAGPQWLAEMMTEEADGGS